MGVGHGVWLQFIHQHITKGWATTLPQPNCLTSTGLSKAQHTGADFPKTG